MNIILSAHFDLAHPVMCIRLNSEKLSGLVDNFAGVFASYQVSRKTGVPVYFTNYEELDYDGAISVAEKLDKETIVIVVDTIKESDISGKGASIANVYDLDVSGIKETLRESVHYIEGLFEETEDETWIYGHQFGLKTLYFGIPIPGEYHSVDNAILLEKIDNAAEILGKLVSYLQVVRE